MKATKAELHGEFDNNDQLSLESLARCKYTEAVLKETLRLYSPVPVGLARVVPKGGASIGGHLVLEGVKISIAPNTIYQDASNFRDPNPFVPERWLGDPMYANDVRDCCEPFSVGPRNYLGKVCYQVPLRGGATLIESSVA